MAKSKRDYFVMGSMDCVLTHCFNDKHAARRVRMHADRDTWQAKAYNAGYEACRYELIGQGTDAKDSHWVATGITVKEWRGIKYVRPLAKATALLQTAVRDLKVGDVLFTPKGSKLTVVGVGVTLADQTTNISLKSEGADYQSTHWFPSNMIVMIERK